MKIISGGQTGVDQIGLMVGHNLGLQTGGWAPKDYKTEIGSNLELKNKYGLLEHNSSDYPPRTEKNIQESDCTWIFGNTEEAGTKLTIKLCKDWRKPHLVNPTLTEMINMRSTIKPQIINIAGNRESKTTKAELVKIGWLLVRALTAHISEEKQELF